MQEKESPLTLETTVPDRFIEFIKYMIDSKIEAFAANGRVAPSGLPLKFSPVTYTAKCPEKSHPSDAGIDMFADEDVVILPGRHATVRLGVSAEIPTGFCLTLWGRSGRASKEGLGKLAGLIDEGYRGEIKAVLFNTGEHTILVSQGERVVQGVLLPVPRVAIGWAEFIPADTDRGESGFGSTGN